MLLRRALAQTTAGVLLSVFGIAAAANAASAAPPPSAESRTPYGEMNLAWTEPGMIGVVGWAKDPDVNRPIDVVVAIDRGLYVRTAGVYNPYLPGRYAEKFRSYLVAIPVTPGPHTMCVAALNVGRGNPFRLLGCKVFDSVASADPTGAVDGVTLASTADRVRVSGWAVDVDTPSPLLVDFTVDGQPAGRATASVDRPDIGAAFPGSGSGHGFDNDVWVSPGRREVCAIARNVNRGGDTSLGCRTVDVPRANPIGRVDNVVAVTNGLLVEGWAGDPDAGRPIDVTLTARRIGGIDDPVRSTFAANLSRPDVGAAVGVDARSGYRQVVGVTEVGTYEVCAWARNVNLGADQQVGCLTANVPDNRPRGAVDRIEPQPSAVRVAGWAWDPDSPAGATEVRITVDGNTTVVTPNQPRPDVAGAVPGAGANQGFDVNIGGLGGGRHTVCVSVTDRFAQGGVSGDRTWPCGSVIVGSTAVGTSGNAGVPIPVGPGGGPLANVDRDAGVSVTLRDGSVVWLFGDSTEFNTDGSLKYFVGGTGAWASAAQPTVTRDAVAAGNRPFLLAAPGGGFPTCAPTRPNRVMWPVSAFKVPDGGRDRVVAFFANMCIGSTDDYAFMGISVAEWYYDPAAPPVGQPVQFSILNQDLDTARAFGTASLFDPGTGYAYLYQCDRPTNPLDLGGYGPCRVARVLPGQVANPASYTYWNGGSWAAGEGSAQPITMPAGALSVTRYPASAFTVVFDAAHGVYVMVYSPWPGFVDRAMVRVSRTPQGPWSEPVEVVFPGCANTVDGKVKACYAGTAQPAFSTSSELGLGYYDQAIPADRNRGQYLVVRVPFVVELS